VRRIGELLKDLGFNKDASVEVQKAFVRHLVKQADKTAQPQRIPETKPESKDPQLSFDAEVLGVVPFEPTKRKIKTR
jgi:hypothetical protein